jgi:hypothetical protein
MCSYHSDEYGGAVAAVAVVCLCGVEHAQRVNQVCSGYETFFKWYCTE